MKSRKITNPTLKMGSGGVPHMLSFQVDFWPSVVRQISSDEKVNCNYEVNSNNRVERSAAHAQFSSVTMAISRLVKRSSAHV